MTGRLASETIYQAVDKLMQRFNTMVLSNPPLEPMNDTINRLVSIFSTTTAAAHRPVITDSSFKCN